MNPREWKNSVLIILVLLVLAILVAQSELRDARILIGSLHLGQSTHTAKGSSPGAERSAIEKRRRPTPTRVAGSSGGMNQYMAAKARQARPTITAPPKRVVLSM